MENIANKARFQSKFGTASTTHDIAARAIKPLSYIPGIVLVLLILAGMILTPFGINLSELIPFWFVIVMNLVFIAMILIKRYCNESFDLHRNPQLFSAYFAEVLWIFAIIYHL